MKGIKNDVLTDIYNKYGHRVYIYLFSLSHSQALAEELKQETFIKAMLALDDDKQDILPWLFFVAKNLWIDYLRKQKYISDANYNDIILVSEDNTLGSILKEEKNLKLYRAINKLKQEEREAITMFYFGELKQEDIAKILGLSHANVRTLLCRTRKKLRLMLK